MRGLILLVFTLTVMQTSSQTSTGVRVLCDGFLPPNNMQISVGEMRDTGMTIDRFNADIDKVTQIYNPIFVAKGMPFAIKKLWNNNNVNSMAYIDNSGVHTVEIWGGLARHPFITDDGLKLVVCHEIGHHIGGVPKITSAGGAWASVEGQSDYFTTMKCLRKVFATDGGAVQGPVDPVVEQQCQKYHGSNSSEKTICQRVAMAGMSSAKLSGSMDNSGTPDFAAHDPSVVSKTSEDHPASQCRLDTYFNGGLCQVADTLDFSDFNPNTGTCRNIDSENYGARPLCWYKPDGSPATNGIAQTPMFNGQVDYTSSDPHAGVNFTFDVTNFSNAAGIYFEAVGPNFGFSQNNDVIPDSRRMLHGVMGRTSGKIVVVPAVVLNHGAGVYSFRVIPLDSSGQKAVGQFSNPATITTP